jgi:hypothetical protein
MGHVETLLAIMDGKTAWTHEEYMFAARLRGHAARRMNHQQGSPGLGYRQRLNPTQHGRPG